MQWFEQLEKKGYVQLMNFLPEQQASQYRAQVLKAKHHQAWSLITTPYHPCTAIKNRIHSKIIDKQRHKQASRASKNGQFSFSFYRSNNTHAKAHGCGDIHQSFSEQLKAKVCQPLALEGTLRDTFFASFIKGQFIDYHTDGSAGKYAFIYQLSKGWQHKYGGQLELYPRKIKFYKKILEPKFNSLALLKLDHPMPHSVRILNNPKHKHRITISGWLE